MCSSDLTIGKVFLKYFSITLVITTIYLTPLCLHQQIFTIVLGYDIANSFMNSSSYSIVLLIVEFGYLFTLDNLDKLSYLLLALAFFGSCCIRIANGPTKSPFTISSSILTVFIVSTLQELYSVPILIICVILSLPRRGIPAAPQKLSTLNWKSVFYMTLSSLISLYCLIYGIQHNSLTLASDSMMSMCSNVSILGSIIADVASRMGPNPLFSYGLQRAPVICNFAAAILQIIAAINVLSSSITSILCGSSPEGNGGNGTTIFVLSIIGMTINLFGAFFLDTLDINTGCTVNGSEGLVVICDLISSASVVFSSLAIAVFQIDWIDPFVSIFLGLILIVVSVPQISESASILMQASQEEAGFSALAESCGSVVQGHIWSLSPDKAVLTASVGVFGEDEETVIKEFSKAHHVVDSTLELYGL